MGLSTCMHLRYIVCLGCACCLLCALQESIHRVFTPSVCIWSAEQQLISLPVFRRCTPCVCVCVCVLHVVQVTSCTCACRSLYMFCIGTSILCVCWMCILDTDITTYLS